MTRTLAWDVASSRYILVRQPRRMILLEDERVALAGPPEVFTALATKIRSAITSSPENAGKKWSDEEDALLRERFRSDPSLGPLARAHGRTRGAIRARLVHLGEIEDPSPPSPDGRRRG